MSSYRIGIKSNNGSIAVTTEGDVPDGEHVITGHEDGEMTSVHVVRRSALGRDLITAEHVTGGQPAEPIAQVRVSPDPPEQAAEPEPEDAGDSDS